MYFIVDENLPKKIKQVFQQKGFKIDHVAEMEELRGRSDQVLFNYAAKNKAIFVTRDVGFVNLVRFPLGKLDGLILIRFPNEISVGALINELIKLARNLKDDDFKKLSVISPGVIRSRDLR